MFFKAKNERPVICGQYDMKMLAVWHDRDLVRGWAQAIIWHSQPLKVLIKDTPEWRAVNDEIREAQLNLRNAMGAYDTAVHEFKEWVSRHYDELPFDYKRKADFETSLETVKYALSDINEHGYFYFKHYIKKEKRG